MRMHFFNRHVWDIVIILEEGNPPPAQCPQYNMLVPWRTLNSRHHATVQCAKGAKRKRRWMAEAELRESTERAFDAYGKPLENVLAFKYLGRVMTEIDDDWPAVAGNLSKARKIWGRLLRILCWEGADARVLGNFFRTVVQAALLIGAETWVINLRMERALDSFQNGAACRITSIQLWRRGDGIWAYTPLKEATREAGFEGIRKSFTRRPNTVAQYIAMRPILDLCERATQRLGVRVSQRWWEQEGIDLEKAKGRAAETTTTNSESEVESEEGWGGGGVSGPSG